MDFLLAMFERYGVLLVFGAVLLEQVGPPIPSGPLLVVAGALATEGRTSALFVAGTAWVACMLGKVGLYVVGTHYGKRAVGALCKFAVTPDSSASKANLHFAHWGAPLLIFAEFVPGIRTLAPSVAGAERVPAVQFLIYSSLGAALWTATFLLLGVWFSKQITEALVLIERAGSIALAAIAVTIVYFAAKWWWRRRSIKASQGQPLSTDQL